MIKMLDFLQLAPAAYLGLIYSSDNKEERLRKNLLFILVDAASLCDRFKPKL